MKLLWNPVTSQYASAFSARHKSFIIADLHCGVPYLAAVLTWGLPLPAVLLLLDSTGAARVGARRRAAVVVRRART